MGNLIGRQREFSILNQVFSSKEAEFIAIYGRRRIGKTFLVEKCFSNKGIYLSCTGLKDGSMKDQLANFIKSFANVFYPGLSLQVPKTWKEAFEMLTEEIKKIPSSKKIILFLDELPWLATRKSKLLQNLDLFWNTEWSRFPNFKLITCGSAASWILNNLINAKGGLHNRITKSILVEPFKLSETKKFLENRKIKFTEKQVLDIYMVTGGVPFYLNQIQRSKSVTQNIQELCFTKDGLLYLEFPRLFKSLFSAADLNLRIIREIAKHRYGISFTELVKKVGKKIGGRFKDHLSELEAAGFIQTYLPYGKKKRDRYYRIIDEYTMFYLNWIEKFTINKSVPKVNNYWIKLSKTPAWQSWAGYAFEEICHKHADKIIAALGLEQTGCIVSNWKYVSKEELIDQGAQIDLIIDRDDGAISLCEIKYSDNPITIDKNLAKILMKKVDVFQKHLKEQKQIFFVMITVSGIKRNVWFDEIVNNQVELKDFY